MFGKAIGDAPLQAYISALLFSPAESIIRKQFDADAPHWARIWPNNVANWTSCVQRLDGIPEVHYDILSVSSCCTWLAACEGRQGGIKIWGIETGRELFSIKFSTKIGSLRWFKFSLQNNNELIVLDSCLRSLEFWDITSRKIVRQINFPHEIIAISLLPSTPDILGMISHDDDKNIILNLWNTQKDEEITTRSLPFEGDVIDIDFSPVDNHILAVHAHTWDREKIIIYKVDTDDIIRTFDFGWMRSLVFSPKGKYLASFTKPDIDKGMPTCTLLDTMTGKTISEFELQGYPDRQPGFSKDGRLLAVASGRLIQIWDLTLRQCLQRTTAAWYCPVFSPTGTNQLFCGCMGSIAVIEVGQHEMAPLDLNPYGSKKKKISISPNGRMVATWDPEILEIWNTEPGAHVFTIYTRNPFESYTGQFSPDSAMIALMSNRSFTIWDISSKKAKQIYHESSCAPLEYDRLKEIVFSSNSRYLAVMNSQSLPRGRDIRRIRVLDIISRKYLLDLKSRPVINAILALSSDSKKLAICLTFDEKGVGKTQVEIRDITSGLLTNAILLHDTYFSDIINAQTAAFNYGNQKRGFFFNPGRITFSDDNHLILGSKRIVNNRNVPLFSTNQKTYKGFNIKVILKIYPTSGFQDEQTVHDLRTQDKSRFDIDPCGSWITLDAERLVWLPPEYRLVGVGCHWDVRHGCVAISNDSTPLFILKFCCSMCPRQMTPKGRTITKCTSTAPEMHKYTYTCNLDDDFDILSFDMDSSYKDMMEARIDEVSGVNDKTQSKEGLSLSKILSRVRKGSWLR